MATTYQAITTVTVGSGGASSIDFTSIPQTYTDLLVVVSARNDAAVTNGNLGLRPNGATTNQSILYLIGNGSGAYTGIQNPSTLDLWTYCCGDGATANTFSNNYYYIPNYTSSNNKSMTADGALETNATATAMGLHSLLWSSTAAITSITLVTRNNNTGASANFKQYSTATLYGIKNS